MHFTNIKQPCWKYILNLFILNQKANWLKKTLLEVSRWLVDQKLLKLFWLEIQDGCHLENLYWTSSLDPKGLLTKNLSGNQVSYTGLSWPSCNIDTDTQRRPFSDYLDAQAGLNLHFLYARLKNGTYYVRGYGVRLSFLHIAPGPFFVHCAS